MSKKIISSEDLKQTTIEQKIRQAGFYFHEKCTPSNIRKLSFSEIIEKDVDYILEYIRNNGINQKDEVKGWTLFDYAAEKEKRALMNILLKNGADINSIDKEGSTALIRSCSNRKIKSTVFLLRRGADVDKQNKYGISALSSACEKNDLKTVELLLEKRTFANPKDEYENSPLLIACRKRNWKAALLLIKHGADVFHAFDELNRKETALYLVLFGFDYKSDDPGIFYALIDSILKERKTIQEYLEQENRISLLLKNNPRISCFWEQRISEYFSAKRTNKLLLSFQKEQNVEQGEIDDIQDVFYR